MYSNPQFGQNAEEVQALRQHAGRWLKSLREDAGLTQRELAKAIGVEYYTFISQIESGRGRVPPAQYDAFAKALGIPLKEFVSNLLRCYDPVTYYALFGGVGEEQPSGEVTQTTAPVNDNQVAELEARIARLEELLSANVSEKLRRGQGDLVATGVVTGGFAATAYAEALQGVAVSMTGKKT